MWILKTASTSCLPVSCFQHSLSKSDRFLGSSHSEIKVFPMLVNRLGLSRFSPPLHNIRLLAPEPQQGVHLIMQEGWMGGDSDPGGGENLQLLPQLGVRSSAVNHLFVCLFVFNWLSENKTSNLETEMYFNPRVQYLCQFSAWPEFLVRELASYSRLSTLKLGIKGLRLWIHYIMEMEINMGGFNRNVVLELKRSHVGSNFNY